MYICLLARVNQKDFFDLIASTYMYGEMHKLHMRLEDFQDPAASLGTGPTQLSVKRAVKGFPCSIGNDPNLFVGPGRTVRDTIRQEKQQTNQRLDGVTRYS